IQQLIQERPKVTKYEADIVFFPGGSRCQEAAGVRCNDESQGSSGVMTPVFWLSSHTLNSVGREAHITPTITVLITIQYSDPIPVLVGTLLLTLNLFGRATRLAREQVLCPVNVSQCNGNGGWNGRAETD